MALDLTLTQGRAFTESLTGSGGARRPSRAWEGRAQRGSDGSRNHLC